MPRPGAGQAARSDHGFVSCQEWGAISPRFEVRHHRGRAARRYRAGGSPNSRLNARLNAASDSYPTASAISRTVSSVRARAESSGVPRCESRNAGLICNVQIPGYRHEMDALEDALRVISSMNAAGVDYVVVGGIAMNLH